MQNAKESVWLPKVQAFAIEEILDLIKSDLRNLGVEFDQFISEASLLKTRSVDKAIKKLKEKNLTYMGKLDAPKGRSDEEQAQHPQLLFRSTRFGDDMDRALKKQDDSSVSYTHLTLPTILLV